MSFLKFTNFLNLKTPFSDYFISFSICKNVNINKIEFERYFDLFSKLIRDSINNIEDHFIKINKILKEHFNLN